MIKIYFFITLLGTTFLCSSARSQNPGNSLPHISVRNLGQNINSKETDFGAYEVSDGLSMFFVSRRKSSSSNPDNFWRVKRTSRDSAWSIPEFFTALNNGRSVGGMTMDDSGRIYFATNSGSSEINDMNIWEARIEGKTLNMNMLPKHVNTIKWESQPSVTSNGKDLYFASNRAAYGRRTEVDIFVTHRNADNNWSMPEELGPQINLGSYNGTPFISPDGQFLFFTSNGGSDSHHKIYMTARTGAGDKDWSAATLLPSEINSEEDDMFPMIASDGKTIYFSSNRTGGFGDFDMYQAYLPPDIQAMIAKSFMKN